MWTRSKPKFRCRSAACPGALRSCRQRIPVNRGALFVRTIQVGAGNIEHDFTLPYHAEDILMQRVITYSLLLAMGCAISLFFIVASVDAAAADSTTSSAQCAPGSAHITLPE